MKDPAHMRDVPSTGRSVETGIAQAAAVVFVGAYFIVPYLAAPFYSYRWALMFVGLACFIPPLITREGRNPRRTDRVLALMFASDLAMSLRQTWRSIGVPGPGLYIDWTFLFVAARYYVLLALLVTVVLSFLFRLRGAKWVLLVFVVADVILMRIPVEPNNPQYLEMRAQAAAQWEAQANQQGAIQVVPATNKPVRAGFPVWHYAFYATALVYAFLLRRPKAPTTSQSQTSEEQTPAQEPRAP
jgi:hypothetical protein